MTSGICGAEGVSSRRDSVRGECVAYPRLAPWAIGLASLRDCVLLLGEQAGMASLLERG